MAVMPKPAIRARRGAGRQPGVSLRKPAQVEGHGEVGMTSLDICNSTTGYLIGDLGCLETPAAWYARQASSARAGKNATNLVSHRSWQDRGRILTLSGVRKPSVLAPQKTRQTGTSCPEPGSTAVSLTARITRRDVDPFVPRFPDSTLGIRIRQKFLERINENGPNLLSIVDAVGMSGR